jgi:hypothetical protein
VLWWSALAPAPQSFRCALQLDLGAPKRYYPCLGARAPQVCPVSGRIVRACDWGFTHSGLADGHPYPRGLLHSRGRGAVVWRVLLRLLRLSSSVWTGRLCQAHSSVGYRHLTPARVIGFLNVAVRWDPTLYLWWQCLWDNGWYSASKNPSSGKLFIPEDFRIPLIRSRRPDCLLCAAAPHVPRVAA